MNARSLESDALVTQYVHVVNEAVGQYDGALPIDQAIDLADGLEAGIALYRSDKSKPGSYFTLGWSNGKLEVLHEGKESDRSYWSMPRQHLENVVEDPATYKESPTKLDLDWLKQRIGLA